MGFGGYVRTRLWEFLFCAVAASALTYTLFSGFYACQPLQALPQAAWVVAACAALTFVLYCIAYRTGTAIAGGVALAVAVAVACAACAAASPDGVPLSDVEGNYTLAVGIGSAVCVLVFLLSRKKAGVVVVLVAGVFACALVEYLYKYGHVWAYLAFLVGTAGLLVFRGYQRSLAESDSDKLAFTSVSVAALALSALALAVAAGAFYGVIAPLNPPAQQVKLIVEHRSQEEIEIRGVGSVAGDTSGGDGNLANGEEQQAEQESSDNLFDTVQSNVAELLGVDVDQTGDVGTTTALQAISFLALIIAALIVLLALLVILVRRLIRRRRYRRMTEGGNAQTISRMYLFFLDRFRRMNVPRPENLSLAEYVRDFSSTFEHFERFGGGAVTARLEAQDGAAGALSGGTRLYPESHRDALLRIRPTGENERAGARSSDDGWIKAGLPRETRLNSHPSVAARSCAPATWTGGRAGARPYEKRGIKTHFPRGTATGVEAAAEREAEPGGEPGAGLGAGSSTGLGAGPEAGPDAEPAGDTAGEGHRLGRSAFDALTGVYIDATYGGSVPTDDEVAAFKDYYRVFYKNARRYVGRFKYLYKFFRL